MGRSWQGSDRAPDLNETRSWSIARPPTAFPMLLRALRMTKANAPPARPGISMGEHGPDVSPRWGPGLVGSRRRCCRPGEIRFFGNCGRSPMSSRPVAGLTDEAPAASAMRFTSLVDGGWICARTGGGHVMDTPPIVSPQEWETAREELLVKEKELTRARDALAAERRRMPMTVVEKEYGFEGPDGPASLLELFDGRRQLIVYRFFYEPGVAGWPERGCGGCSFLADQVAHLAHLNARDTTLAFVSRAPQPNIERWKARMGWQIPWYTIKDDFDADFGVDEWHGTNVFLRDGERVFRTYFVNSRGDEAMGSTWSYLDLTPLGRQEEWEDSPEGYPQTPPYQWWRLHDEYA